MRQVDGLAVPLDCTRFFVYLHTGQAGQAAKGPQVMVAGEKMYVDTMPFQLTEFFAERVELPFLRVPNDILHPKIEHIAEHVDGHGILAHLLQHVDHFFLVRPASLDSQTP
jgi:hypothetical protein